MTGYAAGNLQDAVFDALKDDPDLSAAVKQVYDEPDNDAPMPYVSLGATTAVPRDTKRTLGGETTFTVQTWSNDGGQSEAKELCALVDKALHNRALTIEGHQLINLRLEYCDVIRVTDSDETYYQGTSRYRAKTQAL